MIEYQFVYLHQRWLQLFCMVVQSPILSHNILEFSYGIVYLIPAVVYGKTDLLMLLVGVNVCIARHADVYSYMWFYHRETGLRYGLLLAIFENVHPVVA